MEVDSGDSGTTPIDGDGDGWASVESGGSDCDDTDPRTFPGAVEQCDYADRDCDGDVLPEAGCVEVPDVEAVAWSWWTGDPAYYDSYQAFGYDVAVAGDLDGDGWGEPLVMCPACDDGSSARIGGFYVLESPRTPVLGGNYADHERASWIGDGFFFEMGGIAGAGDFDGDGFTDIAFTGDEYDAPGWLALKYGPMDATWTVRGSIGDTVDAWWYTRSGSGDDSFGNWAFSDVIPDFSGDGLSEIAIGRAAHHGDDGLIHPEVYLFGSGDQRGVIGEEVDEWLSVMDPAEGKLDSVASAGDFNGDGLGDVLVSMDVRRPDGVRRDSHDVLDGSLLRSGGLVAPADVAISSWWARNTGGWGACLTSLGDWNGDGYDDLAFGDEYVVENEPGTSKDDGAGIWFVAGRAAGQVSDEVSEEAVGLIVDPLGAEVTTVQRCAGGGDVDGDGRPDLVVNANRDEGWGASGPDLPSREVVWLVSGRDGLPDGEVQWRDAALALAAHAGFEEHEDASDLGNALSLGDLTADGIDDVLVGAYQSEGERGAVYVIRGWEIDWERAR